MKITTAKTDTKVSSSWLEEKRAAQNKWRAKSYAYKTLIDKLLLIGGDFVYIPATGDPVVLTLSKSAKKSTLKVRSIGETTSANSKAFLLDYAKKNPDRYRVCVGYALFIAPAMSLWTKHYWLLDRKDNQLLESTKNKFRYYFGITLSKEASAKLVENASKAQS